MWSHNWNVLWEYREKKLWHIYLPSVIMVFLFYSVFKEQGILSFFILAVVMIVLSGGEKREPIIIIN